MILHLEIVAYSPFMRLLKKPSHLRLWIVDLHLIKNDRIAQIQKLSILLKKHAVYKFF